MTTTRSLPLALTLGDPAGCGPAITRQAWNAFRSAGTGCFYVVAPPRVFEAQGPTAAISDPSEAAAVFPDALPVLMLDTDVPAITPGHPDRAAASAITGSVKLAVSHALEGHAGAVVTNPISKSVLYAAGFPHPGHTEYLAELCRTDGSEPPAPVMMLVGGGLRVALATIHLPLREAIDRLDGAALQQTAQTVHAALRRDFGIPQPRLAFTGLNPHAGEAGTLGREEIEIVNPAAEALRRSGIDITDARPADTVYAEALDGAFDAVIAMTHDQGLIPVKTLDFWGGVNTTLGLPIIRTSPDHGTAYDAAAKGTARPDSLIAAIRLAHDLAARRAAAADA